MFTKVLKDIENAASVQGELFSLLKSFDLKAFEEELFNYILGVYRSLCEDILQMFCNSSYFQKKCNEKAKELGGKYLRRRNVSLQICTGAQVCFESYYLAKVEGNIFGDRQLFHQLFDTVSNCSTAYTSRVCAQSVMAPSFETSADLLNTVGVESSISRCRRLSLEFGNESLMSRVGLQLQQGESLIGKTVLLSVDGGRSRTRLYSGLLNANGEPKFDTPWREPKLFVIHTIDPATGKQSKQELPLYDCCFGDDECFELMESYLKALKIEQAKHVQFVADGAPWIWNRAVGLLKKLKVHEENITETLDYYHAMEHLGTLLEALPKSVELPMRILLRTKCKELLWNGQIKEMIALLRKQTKSSNSDLLREINYFEKHEQRCNYKGFRDAKLVCGSGIIESGIRRVINLRFKAPASFWDKDNLEPLIFLRAAFLSKRWNTIWENRLKIKFGQI